MLTEGPTSSELAALRAHVEHLQRLLDSGVLILAGRTQTTGPETFGIAIIRAASEDEAKAIMLSDPPVRDGVFSGELFPYSIAFCCFDTAD
jgi:uncharacterized protein YciI